MKKKLILIISLFFISLPNIYANTRETVKLSKCVDGDTIKVLIKDKEYTVRFLAVDTPESVHPTKKEEYYGKEASNYTCNRVKNAKKIELEYDSNSDKTDKYDRLLAWIFLDDKLLQKDLVASGYAKMAYLYGNYKYTNTLKEEQELASAKNIGIWDTESANKFNNNSLDNSKNTVSENEYSTKEIIIITILLLIIVFIGDKSIKNKAKRKIKQYLK